MKRKSYGIICCRYNSTTKKVEFLLEKKRCTYAYLDFILGNYESENHARLQYLFDHMSIAEKIDILSIDFGTMWYRAWLINPDRTYAGSISLKCCYSQKKKKFMDTFTENIDLLRNMIQNSKHCDSVWEFPKGRKINHKESDITAAVREFFEETGIKKTNYRLLLRYGKYIDSFESDGVRYVHHYYLAVAKTGCEPHINFFSSNQMAEIVDIKWMTLDEIKVCDANGKFFLMASWANRILKKNHKIQKHVQQIDKDATITKLS